MKKKMPSRLQGPFSSLNGGLFQIPVNPRYCWLWEVAQPNTADLDLFSQEMAQYFTNDFYSLSLLTTQQLLQCLHVQSQRGKNEEI